MVDFFTERTVKWDRQGKVVLIDQTKLPKEFSYVECASADEVTNAIKDMVVRGAPAIGVAAAMGLALCAYYTRKSSKEEFVKELTEQGERLKEARPTAVNLAWGVNRILHIAKETDSPLATLRERVISEAQRMADEDVETNRKLSEIGSKLIEDDDVVLTHCKCLLQ